MNSDQLSDVVKVLSSLNERELIEVLSKVFEQFKMSFESDPSGAKHGDRYALARSSFVVGEDEKPYIQFLSIPSRQYRLSQWDEALESGKCPTCGTLVACVDKLATCPICDSLDVECT